MKKIISLVTTDSAAVAEQQNPILLIGLINAIIAEVDRTLDPLFRRVTDTLSPSHETNKQFLERISQFVIINSLKLLAVVLLFPDLFTPSSTLPHAEQATPSPPFSSGSTLLIPFILSLAKSPYASYRNPAEAVSTLLSFADLVTPTEGRTSTRHRAEKTNTPLSKRDRKHIRSNTKWLINVHVKDLSPLKQSAIEFLSQDQFKTVLCGIRTLGSGGIPAHLRTKQGLDAIKDMIKNHFTRFSIIIDRSYKDPEISVFVFHTNAFKRLIDQYIPGEKSQSHYEELFRHILIDGTAPHASTIDGIAHGIPAQHVHDYRAHKTLKAVKNMFKHHQNREPDHDELFALVQSIPTHHTNHDLYRHSVETPETVRNAQSIPKRDFHKFSALPEEFHPTIPDLDTSQIFWRVFRHSHFTNQDDNDLRLRVEYSVAVAKKEALKRGQAAKTEL